eukprot:GFUD01008498.1.p2 GENE.GFUD01008498.1~~GFUD01008498.1.p2  ORF type:complete len:196 (-),score=20.56 GFUD01008498.1:170-757(-)
MPTSAICTPYQLNTLRMKTVCLYLFIIIGVGDGKRCRGRHRVGVSCRASCNYQTGQWNNNCGAHGVPSYRSKAEDPYCYTVSGKFCNSPFQYKGEWFEGCTDKDTSNNKLWCATQVDGDRKVISGKWEDCRPDTQYKTCHTKPPSCQYLCETDISDQTKCTYAYSGGSRVGTYTPQYGDCTDQSGPCYSPDTCHG